MRSSTSEDTAERFSKHSVSIYSLISSNNETNEINYARPSLLGKIVDPKFDLSQNGEVNTSNVGTVNNNVQTDKKETTEDNEMHMPFHERDLAFSANFEAKSREDIAKISYSDYFIDDQNE